MNRNVANGSFFGGRALKLPGLVALSALALALVIVPGEARSQQAEGISYSVAPAVNWLRWDDGIGLEDVQLRGGVAGIGFGRFVGLRGYYLRDKTLSTDFSSTSLVDLAGDPLVDQNVEFASYGGDVVITLGSGGLAPLLIGGGGLLEFQPDEGVQSRTINVRYGAGFRARVAQSVTGEVFLEANRHRVDQILLAGTPEGGTEILPDTDPEADKVRNTLGLRAAVGIQLGQRPSERFSSLDQAFENRYRSPFSGLAVNIEPMAGLMQWDNDTGLVDQELAGLRAGFDFGPYFGVRGFYWEGVTEDFDGREPISGWGGEAQFNLNDGTGLTPYLIAGAGKIDFHSDFDTLPELIPADQNALIVGGGVDFSLGRYLRVSASARDYVVAGSDLFVSQDLDAVASPDDLTHNWQFTAGLKFRVGGGGGFRPATEPVPVVPVATPVGARAEGSAAAPGQAAAPAGAAQAPAPGAQTPSGAQTTGTPAAAAPTAAGQTPATRTGAAAAPGTPAPAGTPEAQAAMAAATPGTVAPAGAPAAGAEPAMPTGTPQQQMLTIPIPTVGELYIRFGEPGQGGMRVIQGGQPVTQMQPTETGEGIMEPAPVTTAPAGQTPGGAQPATATRGQVSREDLAALEARINKNINDALDRYARETDRQQQAVPTTPARVTVEQPDVEVTVERTERGGLDPELGFPRREIRTYTGMGFDETNQLMLGVAADLGPRSPGSRLRLVPELALGFGGTGSWMGAVNMQYRLPFVYERDRFWVNPLVSVGAGLFNRDELEAVVNAMYGANLQFRRGFRDRPLNLFVAHQGVQFYNKDRFLVGVSLGR